MRVLLLVIGMLALACGSPTAAHSTYQSSPLAADRQATPELEVSAAPAVSTDAATGPPTNIAPVPTVRPAPVAPSAAPAAISSPVATLPPNPQTFIRVTVAGAPALNCNPPSMTTIDCEDPRAYAMAHFAVGERLPFTRILTDVRGKQFYILGPWTPVGLMPVGDAVPG